MAQAKSFKCCAGILLSVLLAPLLISPARAGGDRDEVWVSARTNGVGPARIRGSGTLADPFYGEFDAIINSLPEATTIHLLPGVFWAHGMYHGPPRDAALKSRQKVIGAGIDVTIIKRDRRFHPDNVDDEGELWTKADGVEVSDLTVDPSGMDSDRGKNNGVGLRGNFCAVRRVKVINSSGSVAHGQECFSIYVGNENTLGGVISECEVSSVQGTYCTAIGLLGQGIIDRNRVFFPPFTNFNQGMFHAYQASGTHDTLVEDNYSTGGFIGFYNDTLSETNLTVSGNSFLNVVNGVGIIKGSHGGWNIDGLAIRNNYVEISTNVPRKNGFFAHAILVENEDKTGTVFFNNVMISGNLLRYYNYGRISGQSGTGGISVYSPIGINVQNVRILDNTVDRSFLFHLNASGTWMADNSDLEGVPLQVRDVPEGSPDTVALNPTDGLIFVTSARTSKILLPVAWGFQGKEVTVFNQKPSGPLTVNPAKDEQLLTATSPVIARGRSARFISDGVGKWIKE